MMDLVSMYVRVFYVVLFFFKQKTAYEMRISDWSSDVCSSDLPPRVLRGTRRRRRRGRRVAPSRAHGGTGPSTPRGSPRAALHPATAAVLRGRSEARRVGNELSVRVDLGGRRFIKKTKHNYTLISSSIY